MAGDAADSISRREFLGGAAATGAAASRNSTIASGSRPEVDEGIVIHAVPSAGPPPDGAPVEISVPFVSGLLRHTEQLAVFSPEAKPAVSQMRATAHWPDGSVQWLVGVFEAEAGPGDYRLRLGQPAPAPDLVRESGDSILVDTGELVVHIPRSGSEWVQFIGAPGPDGAIHRVVEGSHSCDLVLTRHDGKVFRASLAGDSRRVIVEERGPVRACVRLEGKCRAQDGSGLFDCILRLIAYRGRSEVLLKVTWVNATENPAEQVRDIRVIFPYRFDPERLVFGCETGVYDGRFLKDWPVYILQEDHDWYWAKTLNPDGRIQNLSSGGCNGEHCPGWLCIQNKDRSLGVWTPNFWQEYPNELALAKDSLSVGLWPERANQHLAAKPLLPSNPDGGRPYSHTRYWPVAPHPYVAFLDPVRKCLDARQGLAKTQEIVLSVWAGRGDGPGFERKWWDKALTPVRGHLEPSYIASTNAVGPLSPRAPNNSPKFEQLFDESFGYLNRHIDLLKCYGKFDYGDFKYFTAATDYMTHPGTKWGEMGEMAREGYWQNNERDQLRGLLLYYFRSGNPVAWERAKTVAGHLFDVDIRHHPHWGMWTHSYGHCYLALGEGGEPDHSWLSGMLLWAAVTGDSIATDWVTRCGERLRGLRIDFSQADARSGSLYLHMMCQFYRHTGDGKYLKATRPPVEAFLKGQNANGSWPAYMGNLQQPRIEGFVEHVVMALADYYAIEEPKEVLDALDRALVYLFGETADVKVDVGESPLALYGLALLAQKTGKSRYMNLSQAVLEKLHASQNRSGDPYGRGDHWAQWGVNHPEAAKVGNRPAQFLGQTRPLSPISILAYGQHCLAPVAKQSR